jgi:5-methylcytosine-specific restriction endonuclease McrA
MRCSDIRRHLKPYSILTNRTTTVNHAFAAAIAPCDPYDAQKTCDAMRLLRQDPEGDLTCIYCGLTAETWDHVRATVLDKKFSGFGHRLGNLLPCCKQCNSRKGNRSWSDYLNSLSFDPAELVLRRQLIEAYLAEYPCLDSIPEHLPEYQQLQELRRQVLELFAQADRIAKELRLKVHPY